MSDDKPAAPPAEPQAHKHCWHPSPKRHAIELHTDIRCCHCGADRCVKLERVAPQGHGPHLPARDYTYRPAEPIPVLSDAEPDTAE